jgi:predicted small secreted protein
MLTFRFLLMFAILAIGATTLSACNTLEGMGDDASAAAGDDDDDD